MPSAKKTTAKTVKTVKTAKTAKIRMPKTGHHRPACNQGCTFRCEKKGHVVRCEIHPEHLYGAWYQCGTCREADRRLIEQQRREKREQKERGKQEAAETQKCRKKDRRPENKKKDQ